MTSDTPGPTVLLVLGASGAGAQELTHALHERLRNPSLHISTAPSVPASAVLLMGLDLPCAPEQQAAREAEDAQLRAALTQAGTPFRVVYGQGAQRLDNALKAIKEIAGSAYPESDSGTFDLKSSRLRTWHCEKCSDPECEHRLFSALVKPAGSAPA